MYSPRKAAQVIAYLALKSPRRALEAIKAVKLVYLADKESIRLWGAPILDERRVSMPHGPVNSETYSHICGEQDLAGCGWSDFLDSRANNMLAATDGLATADFDELSEADLAALDATWTRFGHMGPWALRDWTHDRRNVPEWQDPHGSSTVIPLEALMAHCGIPDPAAQAQLLRDHKSIDAVFATLR